MAGLPAEFEEGWAQDNAIYRTAKKRWTCHAAGGSPRVHAPECSGHIEKGEAYVEYVGEVSGYQSGTRHSLACALHHGYIKRKEVLRGNR